MESTQRGGTFHRVLNYILAVVYIPYGLICFMMLISTDIVLSETHPLVIASSYLVGYAGFFTAVTAHLCLFLSSRLYNNGRKTASYVVRFLPVITMVIVIPIGMGLELLARI